MKMIRLPQAIVKMAGLAKPAKRGVEFDVRTISSAGLFDADWYLSTYPDVKAAGINPLRHFCKHGWKENRDPCYLFNTSWYLRTYQDVAAAGVNPLAHYATSGEAEGRKPGPNFNPAAFAAALGSPPSPDQNILANALTEMKVCGSLRFLNILAEAHNLAVRKPVVRENADSALPLISIILPVYNSDLTFLSEAIESVIWQTYGNWELIIVDDGSTELGVRPVLDEFSQKDRRVRVHYSNVNSGIAVSSQMALQNCTGEFVAFLDHDDVLVDTALYDVAAFISQNPDVDYIYTDHGMIDQSSRYLHPALKPSWSPEFLFSTNYVVHFKVARRSCLMKIGGFRIGSHVIQDLDVTLRLWKSGAIVRHLPLLLYFWRLHPQSVASGTGAKPSIEKLAVEVYNEHLDRRKLGCSVAWPQRFKAARVGAYKLEFSMPVKMKNSAVVSCVTDGADFDGVEFKRLSECVGAAYVIWLDSKRKAPQLSGLKVLDFTKGGSLDAISSLIPEEYLIFIRPTARLLHKNWAHELIGYLELDENIGLVGGKILDNNLNIAAGAILLLDKPTTMFLGQSDNVDGFWLNMQIASNVSAVSSALMAVRRKDLVKFADVDLMELSSEAFGLAIAADVNKIGKRVVFNPWSKVRDIGSFRAIVEIDIPDFGDRYYNPSFDKQIPFAFNI